MKRMLLLLICLTVVLTSSCGFFGKKSDPWPKTGLGAMLPEPPGTIEIHWDKEDSFWADAENITMDNYRSYLEKCIEAGFDKEAKNKSSGYDAFNEDGYKLSLSCYSDEITIKLEAPIKMSSLKWPSGTAGKLIPQPESTKGKINYEYDDHFSLYVGEMTRETYEKYVEQCAAAGFSIDYERGDDYYRAENEEGYRLSLEYEGFGTMSVSIKAPDVEEITDVPATSAPTSAPTGVSTPDTSATTTPSNDDVSYDVGNAVISIIDTSYSNRIRVGIPVTNTGKVNLYLSSGQIDIEDSAGALVQSFSSMYVNVFPQVLAPGEAAYYYVDTTYDGTVTEGLKAVPHLKIEKAKVDLIRFELSELRLEEDLFGTYLTGRVKNTSGKEDSLVYVTVNFLDKNGKIIGQQFTIITDKMQPDEKLGFKTSAVSSHFENDEVSSYEAFAFPYQYQF